MVYELEDTTKVEKLFAGWEETLIWSCIQKVMGKIYVTDLENPESASAFLGCFGFLAGKPDKELVLEKPKGFFIVAGQNEEWEQLIEECYPDCKKVTRYAVRKDTVFDIDLLKQKVSTLTDEYELKNIDSEMYDQCLANPVLRDFVSVFESKEQYLELGRGKVILKNGKIVSGASSYTRYKEGIEIEIDTIPEEKRKGLAEIVSAALILDCLEEGLYPSWDAQNTISLHISEKLGYEFSHEYNAYEIDRTCRVHD